MEEEEEGSMEDKINMLKGLQETRKELWSATFHEEKFLIMRLKKSKPN